MILIYFLAVILNFNAAYFNKNESYSLKTSKIHLGGTHYIKRIIVYKKGCNFQ